MIMLGGNGIERPDEDETGGAGTPIEELAGARIERFCEGKYLRKMMTR